MTLLDIACRKLVGSPALVKLGHPLQPWKMASACPIFKWFPGPGRQMESLQYLDWSIRSSKAGWFYISMKVLFKIMSSHCHVGELNEIYVYNAIYPLGTIPTTFYLHDLSHVHPPRSFRNPCLDILLRKNVPQEFVVLNGAALVIVKPGRHYMTLYSFSYLLRFSYIPTLAVKERWGEKERERERGK